MVEWLGTPIFGSLQQDARLVHITQRNFHLDMGIKSCWYIFFIYPVAEVISARW